MTLQIASWAYQPQVWVIVGLILVVLEVTDGSAIFFLPMGIGAELMALWIFTFNEGVLPENWMPTNWYWLLAIWIVISLLATVTLARYKKFKASRDENSIDDINNY
mgnify:FL=1|tara:strand:+ start:4044 stop:4361 length:318 start_codon:yes stop_codon:yes gene_type:complete